MKQAARNSQGGCEKLGATIRRRMFQIVFPFPKIFEGGRLKQRLNFFRAPGRRRQRLLADLETLHQSHAAERAWMLRTGSHAST
jgi:hypothetical protein